MVPGCGQRVKKIWNHLHQTKQHSNLTGGYACILACYLSHHLHILTIDEQKRYYLTLSHAAEPKVPYNVNKAVVTVEEKVMAGTTLNFVICTR